MNGLPLVVSIGAFVVRWLFRCLASGSLLLRWCSVPACPVSQGRVGRSRVVLGAFILVLSFGLGLRNRKSE
eukprot:5964707-Alexandrium_andersonii.AAC.1